MSGPWFDLQSHSHHSDGALTPTEVVRRAARAGLTVMALSDHDTVAGVAEACAAGEVHGVHVVPAVEITAIDGERQDLHLLGYEVDVEDAGLLEALAGFRADRDQRAGRMATALRELGWTVERADVHAAADGGAVGRPHLAAAAFGHPDNAARVRDEGLTNPSELLVAYLIEGAPAFRGRTTPTVREAIDAVHDAAGVAVWAHPFWDVEDPDEVVRTIERFARLELDGVEAFYVAHDAEQTAVAHAACERLGLLSTGSADFHGPEHPHFSRPRAFELHGLLPRLGPIAARAGARR